MVWTKSRGYSNSGRFSEGEYSMPFFCTRHSPIEYINRLLGLSIENANTAFLLNFICMRIFLGLFSEFQRIKELKFDNWN